MRLTRCWLLRCRTLQHRMGCVEHQDGLAGAVRPHRSRAVLFSIGRLHHETPFVDSFFSARSPHEDRAIDRSDEIENDILTRAKAYNIHTLAQLAFESHVMPSSKHNTVLVGNRLVDRQPYKEDFYYWTILLDWQRLKYGDKGIRLIWEGLKVRCGTAALPFVGYQGDRFWSAFIAAGTRNHRFLEEVIRYELRKGCQRPGFFAEVVGALLKSKSPSSAKSFARMLQVAHRPSQAELYEMFVLASNAEGRTSLQVFCDVYAAMPSAGLYGKVIGYLCTHQRMSDAWMMHRYLLSREDLPQSFEELQPLVLDLVNHHMRPESLLHELARAGVSMAAQARTFYWQERSLRLGFASENLNIVSSRTLGVRPRNVSDEFAARAFLTTAFSFDAILSGLRLVGLKAVGPSSMRAIGLTAGNAQELTKRLDKLADNDVDTGSSRFSRLVKQLARQEKETLLKDILHSDQHADVFEDLRLQRRLLLKYYRDEDWPNVERTLAILTTGSDLLAVEEHSANLLLQAALAAGKWTHVQKIMAEMVRDKHRFNEISIARMYSAVLSRREPAGLPVAQTHFDDIGFLVIIWLEVLKSGSRIPVVRWREPIRRLGMCGRLDELEILLVQLLRIYGEERDVGDATHSHANVTKEAEQLLSPELQSAIIAWGFIHTRHIKPASGDSAAYSELRRYPWLRGLLFLRSLKDRHKCNVDVKVVRKACLLRLRQLFNHRTESILLRNRRSRSRTRTSLSHYVRALDKAWREPLFSSNEWLYQVVTARASVNSRHERRVGTRRQFGKRELRKDVSGQAALGYGEEGYTRNKEKQNMPDDVVLHGGPLSQAYWSARR